MQNSEFKVSRTSASGLPGLSDENYLKTSTLVSKTNLVPNLKFLQIPLYPKSSIKLQNHDIAKYCVLLKLLI